ncbi:MAG TPA: hypothetical protein VKA63_04665 [Candidatus Krumholzibacteria bacterium]|nr:hypothetical protein [Candidatus Krumholzibacteria bacterium]
MLTVRKGALLVVLAALLATVASPLLAAEREVAVIVNPKNPVNEVSLHDLRQIFRLDKTFWPNGKKIRILMLEHGTYEKDLILKRVYNMTDTELRQYWVRKITGLESSDFPRAWSSSAAVKIVVHRYPSAIGYIDARQVDSSVKVLAIDGKKPGQSNYPLVSRTP